MNDGPAIVSLCTGYGGLDAAVAANFGGQVVAMADNDPGAAAILAHAFPDIPNLGDITAIDWQPWADKLADRFCIICGGFPCQDVSCAGARRGLRAGSRSGVWSHIARAVAELTPDLVVLENVGGLHSAHADSPMEWCPWCLGETDIESALRASGAVLGDLADIGYDAVWTTVSAAEFGAPHLRKRVFFLAWPNADPIGGELQRRRVAGVVGGAEG